MAKGGSITWVKWDPSTARTVIRRGPHQLTKRICNWAYCSRCGLVALKNDVTRRALKRECVTEEDA